MKKNELNDLWFQMKDEYQNFRYGVATALIKSFALYKEYQANGGRKIFQPLEDLTK